MQYNPLYVKETNLVNELKRVYLLLDLPRGMVVSWYGNPSEIPLGYLRLDGSVKNRNDYPELSLMLINNGFVTTYTTETFTLPTVTNGIIKT